MKLLRCPCELERYCGTMIGSIKLHRLMYHSAFHRFIHSHEGLRYLLSTYDGNTEVAEAINDSYDKLR